MVLTQGAKPLLLICGVITPIFQGCCERPAVSLTCTKKVKHRDGESAFEVQTLNFSILI